MHFKRLRLAGFKSFVDPSELWIEPGLTGIVGPNGCGKSNLLEALRWVMGESRPKSLRGGGMEDVIFSGTDMRPRRNLADVSLLIDNSERTAPAHYNDNTDIEVSRRIERDLGSLYRINGRDVRQKDVQLLFADAATGAMSPALVSQGRVGALINAKPQDRRQLLEDAAGISGLYSRRREAELKLKAAGTNLERLEDTLLRMEAQAAALKRQARQAVRYRELSEQIRHLEAQMALAQWLVHQATLTKAADALKETEANVTEATSAAAAIATQLANLAADLPALRQTEAEAAAALSRLEAEANTLVAEKDRITALQSDLAKRLEDADRDQAREADYQRDAETSLKRTDADLERLSTAMQGDESRAEALSGALATAKDAAAKAQSNLDAETEALAQARENERSAHNAATQAENALESARQALSEQEAAHEALLSQTGPESVASGAHAAVESAEAALAASEQAAETARSALEAAIQDARTAQAATDEAKAKLRQLDSEIAGLSAALQASATHGDEKPIADLIQISPGFELALGAALGDGLDLPADRGPRYWHKSAPHADDPSLPDTLEPLAKKVSGAPHLQRLLSQTALAPDEATASRLADTLAPGQQIVTKQGGLWRWDGLRATADAPTAASLRPAQRNHLVALEEQRPDLEQARAASLELATQKEALKDDAQAEDQRVRQALQQATQALQAARAEARNVEAKERALTEKRSARAATLEARRSAVEPAEQNAAASQQAVKALPDLSDQDAALAQTRALAEEARNALAEARAAHDSHTASAQGRKRAYERTRFERKQWQDRAEIASAQQNTLAERRTEIAQALDDLKTRPADIARRQDALRDQLEKQRQARSDAADALAAKETMVRTSETERNKAQEALTTAREARARCEADLSSAAARRDELRERCLSHFDCSPIDLLPLTGLGNENDLELPEAIERQLERRKAERERLGAVNLRADVELQELETEIHTLRAEKDELETAIARLRGAIGALNREGRSRLMTAFDAVNDHFGTLFTTLFGGGEAHITLIESDAPLDAGLEIMASPPGKKLQALSLLSGGEQALTALSLIFAVFMTNPAPICVLDEVDAPLDDANVERFCTLLEEMVSRTQTRFLIVTHNALTMSRMHRLFGVTMAERGVSQLVSVDLKQAETMVAAE
ncbi:MAG: chromosome segregation protein SMC [Sphingomonadales bacterium]